MVMTTPDVTDEAREEARRYVRRKRILYTVVGFYWPMLGTGIGVAITAIALLGFGGLFGVAWERREMERYLRRKGNDPAR